MYKAAATIFAHQYGKEAALKHGFRASEIHEGGFQAVQAGMSDKGAMEVMAMNIGWNLSYLNQGLMSQMQADPKDELNFCFTSTQETNKDLLKLADVSKFMTGGFQSENFAS